MPNPGSPEYSPAIVVMGAGDATGGAIAKRFAREGYAACVVRRDASRLSALVEQIESAGGKARPFGVDARDEEQVVALFDTIEREVGPVEVAVFNIGANVSFPITETTSRVFRKVWEMACYGGFLTGREAAKRMLSRGRGTIIFTGAIDTPWIAQNFPERHALKDRDGILNPDDIAEAYWQLHRQPRSAWTLELDLRPWMEPF